MEFLFVLLFALGTRSSPKSPQPTSINYGDVVYRAGIPKPSFKIENHPFALNIAGKTFYPDVKSIGGGKVVKPAAEPISNQSQKSLLMQKQKLERLQRLLARDRMAVIRTKERVQDQIESLRMREKRLGHLNAVTNRKFELLREVHRKNEELFWKELLFDVLCSIFFGLTAGLVFFAVTVFVEMKRNTRSTVESVGGEKVKQEKTMKNPIETSIAKAHIEQLV
ncbi:MAG: uncharacterized protein A8A55_1379 [Amphiamblys sp. WSBS2006]|nr:MAG: uncharacterized protein A8A55_1379 [Amphiamblys sp. WSBS2006]